MVPLGRFQSAQRDLWRAQRTLRGTPGEPPPRRRARACL